MSKAILLVDDDSLIRKSLRLVLKARNYLVTTVASGEEAIELIKQNKTFDLIISDVRMPGRSGIEVVETIQNLQRQLGKESQFMFITGYADEDAPQYAARLNVTEFILKPFDIDKFISAVERQLELRSSNKEGSALLREGDQSHPGSQVGKWKFPRRTFVLEKQVLLKQTNVMGNTYYDNYLTWQGEVREKLLLSHPDIEEWMKSNKEVKMITHSIYHRFLTETTFSDIVRMEATTREIKKCSFIMVFRFFNSRTNISLGEGWQRICFADLRTGKLSSIPQIILDLIEPIREEDKRYLLGSVGRGLRS